MKICILYGSPRKKNTYAAVQQIKERLRLHEEVEFVEYILQKEPHDFCCGCYTCINGAEEKCPHAAHVQPVIQAMRGADGLIFATPVYVMDMTAQMKAFLDHTGYFYIVHRPYPEMFQKSALVVSTAAGAGTKDANASVIRSLKHWGVRRIYSCGISIFAPGWDAIPASRKRKIEKRLDCVTDAFWRSLGAKKRPTMHTRLLFFAMKQMQKRKKGTGADATYWKRQGWLDGKKPF